MKKTFFVSCIAVIIMIITGAYYISLYNNLSNNVVRLHVIANSNSEEDIRIKYNVRDRLLGDVSSRLDRNSSREEVLKTIPEFEHDINDYLARNGVKYRACIDISKSDIERKEYDGIVMPKGKYTAIRVVLGSGKGENWWCVAYPPLCFTESTCGKLSKKGKELLKKNLDNRSYRLITSDIKYELKIVEVTEKVVEIVKERLR